MLTPVQKQHLRRAIIRHVVEVGSKQWLDDLSRARNPQIIEYLKEDVVDALGSEVAKSAKVEIIPIKHVGTEVRATIHVVKDLEGFLREINEIIHNDVDDLTMRKIVENDRNWQDE